MQAKEILTYFFLASRGAHASYFCMPAPFGATHTHTFTHALERDSTPLVPFNGAPTVVSPLDVSVVGIISVGRLGRRVSLAGPEQAREPLAEYGPQRGRGCRHDSQVDLQNVERDADVEVRVLVWIGLHEEELVYVR